jgi:hypothetical protein
MKPSPKTDRRDPWTRLNTTNAILGSLPLAGASPDACNDLRERLVKLPHPTLRRVYLAIAGPESPEDRRSFYKNFRLVS